MTAVDAFIQHFARSILSGHQHSFAHRTLPSLLAVVVREDQPVNLVSALRKAAPTRRRRRGPGRRLRRPAGRGTRPRHPPMG
ncbi:type I-E CRISPR-associated protein Cas7/Cse4/CasC [Nonomuraea sp. NPDC050643]|uniref:type I-E CRISPR-associated protein Cas7/Cse4/CasC n=1 Tax=Nonomuraea sp. NPDC050643 TaxID=3155660 RepID=UPI0033DF487C